MKIKILFLMLLIIPIFSWAMKESDLTKPQTLYSQHFDRLVEDKDFSINNAHDFLILAHSIENFQTQLSSSVKFTNEIYRQFLAFASRPIIDGLNKENIKPLEGCLVFKLMRHLIAMKEIHISCHHNRDSENKKEWDKVAGFLLDEGLRIVVALDYALANSNFKGALTILDRVTDYNNYKIACLRMDKHFSFSSDNLNEVEDCIAKAVEKGLDPDTMVEERDPKCSYPLLVYATSHGNITLFTSLLEHGANSLLKFKTKNNKERTPLRIAEILESPLAQLMQKYVLVHLPTKEESEGKCKAVQFSETVNDDKEFIALAEDISNYCVEHQTQPNANDINRFLSLVSHYIIDRLSNKAQYYILPIFQKLIKNLAIINDGHKHYSQKSSTNAAWDDAMEFLISHGLDAKVGFDYALQKGNYKRALLFLEQDIIDLKGYKIAYVRAFPIFRNKFPLEKSEFEDCIIKALEKGLDPNALIDPRSSNSIQSQPLLGYAFDYENVPLAALLLEHGANPLQLYDTSDGQYTMPEKIALWKETKNETMINLIKKYSSNCFLTKVTTAQEFIELAETASEFYREFQVEPDKCAIKRFIALASPSIIKRLKFKKNSLHPQLEDGVQRLLSMHHWSSDRNSSSTEWEQNVAFLIEHGLDTKIAIKYAFEKCAVRYASTLLDNVSDLNGCDISYIAYDNKLVQSNTEFKNLIIKALKKGLNPNTVIFDTLFSFSLRYACPLLSFIIDLDRMAIGKEYDEKLELVKLLLDHGASPLQEYMQEFEPRNLSPNAKHNYKTTPLQEAENARAQVFVDLMKSYLSDTK
jgi:hypothetical protein